VDADPQGSAYDLSQILAEPGYEFVAETDPAALARLQEVSDRELILVDTPGNLREDSILGKVLACADLIIIPSGMTVTALRPTLATIEYIRKWTPGKPYKVLLSNISSAPGGDREARELLAGRDIPCFAGRVTRHAVHENALRDGVPISRYPGRYAAMAQADLLSVLVELRGGKSELAASPMAAG
jgi:cellulose biosynthesis protein BcsQ